MASSKSYTLCGIEQLQVNYTEGEEETNPALAAILHLSDLLDEPADNLEIIIAHKGNGITTRIELFTEDGSDAAVRYIQEQLQCPSYA